MHTLGCLFDNILKVNVTDKGIFVWLGENYMMFLVKTLAVSSGLIV